MHCDSTDLVIVVLYFMFLDNLRYFGGSCSNSYLCIFCFLLTLRVIILGHNLTSRYFGHFSLWTHLGFLVIFGVLATNLTIFVEAKVLHLKTPFYAVEWVVAQ